MWFIAEPFLRIIGVDNLSWAVKSWDCPAPVYQEWAFSGRHKKYIFETFKDSIEKPEDICTNQSPVMSISIESDLFAPRTPVDWLFKRFTRQYKTVKQLEMNRSQFSKLKFSTEEIEALRIHINEKIGHNGIFTSTGEELMWPQIIQYFKTAEIVTSKKHLITSKL